MTNATYEIWITMEDKNVCIHCRTLHGMVFRQGEGPQPPLHRRCRCLRQHFFTQPDNPPTWPMPFPYPMPPYPDIDPRPKRKPDRRPE